MARRDRDMTIPSNLQLGDDEELIDVDDPLDTPLPDPSTLPTTAQPAAPLVSSVHSTYLLGGRQRAVMHPYPNIITVGGRKKPAELSGDLKENLRRLKNLLKLPRARRFVHCEFFYSGVDKQLFLTENEFQQLLRESFPNLKTRFLRQAEWRTVRRLIGRPRRCSPAFLSEERRQLQEKRDRIRRVYDGSFLSEPNSDFSDLPAVLPRPLAVGSKVYCRVYVPKEGIYSGTIDAILTDSYRIIFDKVVEEEDLPAQLIPDTDVMADFPVEMLPITYYLEQNRAAIPNSLQKLAPLPLLPTGKSIGEGTIMKSDVVVHHQQRAHHARQKQRDEKVGNFPVRLLVILVKLSKSVEKKRLLVKQLTDMNSEAERANLLSDTYHFTFKEKYAQIVVDLEHLNKQIQQYTQCVNEYHTQLQPQLTEVAVSSRPDALRKFSTSQAVQIVKHCNKGVNVRNRRALDLITSLTALLLQVRQLGQHKCTPLDLHALSETIDEMKKQILPQNTGAFQDYVEVHMKQIHNMMMRCGAI